MQHITQDSFLDGAGLQYLQLRHRLLLAFLMNVGYYMYMRTKMVQTAQIAAHPCIAQLVKLREQFAALEPVHARMLPILQQLLENDDDDDEKTKVDFGDEALTAYK